MLLDTSHFRCLLHDAIQNPFTSHSPSTPRAFDIIYRKQSITSNLS